MHILRLSLLSLLIICAGLDRPPAADEVVIAFWNVENLFDTADDPDNPGDDEYLPENGWTDPLYQTKLDRLAEVIAAVAPHALGLAEVENRRVLEDLVAHDDLTPLEYQIVHRDSPDSRGIDVALLLRKPFALAAAEGVRLHPFAVDGFRPTRGILEVPLTLDGETLTILVNHWPARGGDRDGRFRAVAGQTAWGIVEGHLSADPDAAVVVMGDFNDDPYDPSVQTHLGAVRSRNAALNRRNGRPLWNPSWALLGETDRGTLYYNREWVWNVFDQIVVTKGLLDDEGLRWVDRSFDIHAPDKLRDQYRRPLRFRMFRGGGQPGYSDHFMVLARLRYGA